MFEVKRSESLRQRGAGAAGDAGTRRLGPMEAGAAQRGHLQGDPTKSQDEEDDQRHLHAAGQRGAAS